MKKTLFILLLALLAACSGETSRPTLRIASDATFAPFHLVDDAGNPTGFDIELARMVATEAGFEPEVLVLPYDDLFTGLKVKTHDVAAAARASQGRLAVLPEPVALERYAFGLADHRQDLKAWLDEGLAQLQKSGEIAKLRVACGVERGPDWPVAW